MIKGNKQFLREEIFGKWLIWGKKKKNKNIINNVS